MTPPPLLSSRLDDGFHGTAEADLDSGGGEVSIVVVACCRYHRRQFAALDG